MISKLKKLLKNLLLLLLTLLLLGGCLFGIISPEQTQYKKVGNYILFVFKGGIAISQPRIPIFYNISPIEMFYLDGNNNKINVAIGTDVVQEYLEDKKVLPKTWNTFLSYFGLKTIKATAINNEKYIGYNSTVEENKIIFRVNKSKNFPETLFSRIIINPEDIIFDNYGNIYSNNDENRIQEINNYLIKNGIQVELKKSAEKTENLSMFDLTNIYILNDKLNGIIKVSNTETQKIRGVLLQDNFKRMEIELNKNDQKVEIELISFGNTNQ